MELSGFDIATLACAIVLLVAAAAIGVVRLRHGNWSDTKLLMGSMACAACGMACVALLLISLLYGPGDPFDIP